MPTVAEMLQASGAEIPASPSAQPSPPTPQALGLTEPSPIPQGTTIEQLLAASPSLEPPPFSQQLKESTFGPGGFLGPEAVLTTAGGTLGALSPIPGGTYAGSAGGAMLGKGLEDLWQAPQKDPMTALDWAEELGWAGVKGAALQKGGEAVGDLFAKGTEKVLRPLGDKAIRMRSLIIKNAERFKIMLTAGQATAKGWLSQIEGIPGRFPVGSGPALRFAEVQNKQMENAVIGLIRQIHPKYAEAKEIVGNALKSGSEKQLEAAKQYKDILFDGIDSILSPKAEFPMPTLYRMSKTIAEEEAGLKGVLSNQAKGVAGDLALVTEKIPGAGAFIDPASAPASFIQAYNLETEQAQTMSFKRIRDIQTRLGNLSANHPDPQARRHFARLYKALDEDLGEIANSNPGLGSALNIARDFYKNRVQKDFIKSETFKNLQQKDASLLAGTLLGPGVSVEEVRRLKKIVPKDSFDKLTAGMLWDILGVRSRGEAEEFSIRKFINATNKRKYSPEVMKEILGPERSEALDSLRKVFLAIHKSQVGGGNSSMTSRAILGERQLEDIVKMAGMGALQVASGGALVHLGINPIFAAAVSAFGPLALAKTLYSKNGAAFLSKGLKINKLISKNKAFETGRIPVMLGLGYAEWPFKDEEELRGALKDMMEITTPQTPALLNPTQGVPVEIPK